ncbi:translocon-associated protein subunit alpha-like isoform X1 [Iris pallida]|uniref:Translocon-associated protein subunit alpha n=1 Tax=Iris pallida TaxID=29817 RepID=A0AAX6F9K8_IRIPA|nr:translocon-associated protein subunit alpha-like isoform X1 [Iris pallida]
MGARVFSLLFVVFLVGSPFLQVVRCHSDAKEVVAEDEGGELGIVGDETQEFSDGSFSSAPGVDTICVFPKNSARLVPAGEETELLVGLHNEGEGTLNVIAVQASIHLPFDHRMLVQNLTVQQFYNASVPLNSQATFPYNFAVSKYLQAGGFLSIESVFLVTLGVALLGLLGLWAHGQIQNLTKKTKRAPKVEVGTRATEANMDEWLQGTAYAQSLSSKSKKKK